MPGQFIFSPPFRHACYRVLYSLYHLLLERLTHSPRQIAHEPNVLYPPEKFMPECFLDAEHLCIDLAMWAFGFGRRYVFCPVITTVSFANDRSPKADS